MREDQRDKATAAFIGSHLSRHRPARAGECPDPDILAAYYERSLGRPETRSCDTHVASCHRCQQQLAALARSEPAGVRVDRSVGWLRMPAWRWLVPAAAAGTALAIWLSVRTPPPSTELPSPAKAMKAETPSESTTADPRLDALTSNKASAHAPDIVSAGTSSTDTRRGAVEQRNAVATPTEQKRDVPAGRRGNTAEREESDRAEPATQRIERTDKDRPKTGPAPRVTPLTKATVAGNAAGAGALAREPAPPADAAASILIPSRESAAMVNQPASAPAADEKARSVNRPVLLDASVAPHPMRVVVSPDSAVRWRIGRAGHISRSQDAGVTWTPQVSGVTADLSGGTCPSPAICWVVGATGTIVKTIDGEHWTTVLPPVQRGLTAIQADDAVVAIVTADNGHRYRTSDGGRTWQPQDF